MKYDDDVLDYLRAKIDSQSRCLQSTSLPKEVAEQLDDMFEHKPPGAAADTIKHQYKKLRTWQAKLGHMEPEPNQQMDDIVRRQVVLHQSLLWLCCHALSLSHLQP